MKCLYLMCKIDYWKELQMARKKIFIFSLFILFCTSLFASYYEKELTLKGRWLFMIGDDASFSEKNYNDSEWTKIWVPENWEEEGFPGYDGYAWYRVHFKIPQSLRDKSLYIRLGRIDDVDETYLNGQLIGSKGSFEPKYESAYNQDRLYSLPESLIRFDGENVLAVRVYDSQDAGGIVGGKIGIYSRCSPDLLVQFSPQWRFSTGDDSEWSKKEFDDQDWDQIDVPSPWENQGYSLHDGYAWYRKEVEIPKNLTKGHLVLFLGKIDDEDEVYFNGKLIGHTGNLDTRNNGWGSWDNWKKERFYYLPKTLINEGQKNIIAIRIYDQYGEGGLYEDAPGLLTQSAYLSYRKGLRRSNGSLGEIIENIIEAIFN